MEGCKENLTPLRGRSVWKICVLRDILEKAKF